MDGEIAGRAPVLGRATEYPEHLPLAPGQRPLVERLVHHPLDPAAEAVDAVDDALDGQIEVRELVPDRLQEAVDVVSLRLGRTRTSSPFFHMKSLDVKRYSLIVSRHRNTSRSRDWRCRVFRLDTHTHKLMGQDRIDSLNRSRRIEAQPIADAASVDGHQRGGVTPAPPLSPARASTRLRLPFAAAELEAAARALPRPVNPAHVGAAAPARLDLRHGTNLRGPADAPCYTRPAGRRSSVG